MAMPVTGVEAHRLFPRHRRSAGRARTALRQQLIEWKIDSEPAETAVLLLSGEDPDKSPGTRPARRTD
ncbi:hypothetical protein ACFXPV_35125 [Streptomyces sp. NPDC059118]|uniref:hypothetical protein n=1 Tax=unclassified Streptomyces TaxID=2593676 RepID=UPI00368F15B4